MFLLTMYLAQEERRLLSFKTDIPQWGTMLLIICNHVSFEEVLESALLISSRGAGAYLSCHWATGG